jgi:spermidine synthase/S-adenosylmethionine/arginine decarboxylase-like enzyme
MQADHMTLIDRDINDVVKSPYQRLVFLDHEIDGVKDKCLELDDMLQICSSFRAHYHDYVTHFPARYKQEIKRVLFVGGGDSMVLHEMLKYPNIELIVGLELDQTVVRESMKQFRTSPHFDDERVQWWFGDATKSLLMLPKEYFGSFDMVMVDLSETVMSFSVIKNLDIMEALALLIKPDGIMIKNDLHFRKMSDIFDYTIQLSVKDTPLICEQAFVLGSNVVDFLRPDANVITKGHGVDMLLLEPVKDIDDSFKLVQKYRKNDARQQGKCDNLVSDADVKVKRAGLFMVVEAENAKGPLMGDKLEKAIKLAIESRGLTPISTIRNPSKTKGEHIVIVMKEGIIVARTWPKEKYCAFDIHLWGRFNRMDDVKSALSNAVGSKKESVSSFRIIVGGMRGTDTWKDDKKVIGPKISYNRDCDVHPGTGAIDQGVIDTVVDESLNLIDQENAVCLVICGSEDQTCSSFDVVQKSDKVKSVIPIYTCPNVKNVDFHSDANTRMSACEIETLKTIRDQVAKKGAISSLVLDTSTPMSMVQIMTNILHNPRNQGKLLMSRVVFLAPMPIEHGDEFWRTAFLDRSRSNLSHDSKFRVEMMLHGADNDVEIGLLSTGNSKFFARLVEFSDAVQSRTGVQVKISDIIGAPPKDSEEYKPKYFTTEDYGDSNEEQYRTQKPLGHQIVSQIKISSGKSASAFGEVLSSAIDASLKEAKFSETPVQVFDQVGDGIVVVAVAPEGTALAVWDGNQRITLNVFSFESDDAISIFETFTKNLPSAKALSRDEQPRGINRVVNFAKDV